MSLSQCTVCCRPAPFPTRVTVPSCSIDLPLLPSYWIVPGQGPDNFPACDIGCWWDAFALPEQEGTTWLYAHAAKGMFGNLLRAAGESNDSGIVGSLVVVFTDDDWRYTYSLDTVKRRAVDAEIGLRVPPGEHRVVLSTCDSEDPSAGSHLQVAGHLVRRTRTTHAAAHPPVNPRPCYPTAPTALGVSA